MILYPAVDILDGNAVRLSMGDFTRSKVYDADPCAAAAAWVRAGADHLHVVDLDGARAGQPRNLESLRRIASTLGVPVQYGGGLRSEEAIDAALEAGAARAVLGTAAFTDPDLLRRALTRWPAEIVVSVDARDGLVATAGWTRSSELTPEQAITELAQSGVQHLVYTDVDRDGMLEGPSFSRVRAAAEAADGVRLIYSGGIGQLADLDGLAALHEPALAGVIVGKALYERRFTLAQARAALAR
ncbi:MAG: 1-(5-phosphoribosyl)-5-[(5-phosphoribosylamino)methylideneamino]imidazole-4-carboxamide isomerase [Solirubrobacteraceae bacterium]